MGAEIETDGDGGERTADLTFVATGLIFLGLVFLSNSASRPEAAFWGSRFGLNLITVSPRRHFRERRGKSIGQFVSQIANFFAVDAFRVVRSQVELQRPPTLLEFAT